MTPDELSEIRQRADAQYPGPWLASKQYDFRYVLSSDNCILLSGKKDRDEGILQFVAHARTDVPALCSSLEVAQAEIAELRQKIGEEGKAK